MALGWGQRRQLFFIGIFALIAALLVAYFVYLAAPSATCFDGKRNQGEKEVDCGGPCVPCLENLSEPIVLWTRLFELAEGFYEVAALVENTHNFASANRLFYRVKIYDENNIVIGLSEGETFVNPNEKFLILEPSFSTGERQPVRALVEFEPVEWRYADYSPPNITVVSRRFSLMPRPVLSAVVKNNDIFSIENIQVSAVLSDEDGKVIGASLTSMDSIEGQSEKTVTFSWPGGALEEEPRFIEFLIRRFVPSDR